VSRPKSDAEKAREFCARLRASEIGPLGDALVLEGGRAYLMEVYGFSRKALTGEFMSALDEARINREILS